MLLYDDEEMVRRFADGTPMGVLAWVLDMVRSDKWMSLYWEYFEAEYAERFSILAGGLWEKTPLYCQTVCVSLGIAFTSFLLSTFTDKHNQSFELHPSP